MIKTVKILSIIVVFGGLLVFSAAAENGWTKEALQEMYMEYLTQEGYRPEIDEDGDIRFRVLGNNYFIIVDEKDQQFFQIYTGFWLDSLTLISKEEAHDLVNFANRRSKVAKISLSSPEDTNRIIVSITAELLVNEPQDFALILPRSLSLIANAKNIFQTQLASK
ncbi:MAG: hypothetical protein LBC80_00825 [Treponema sp.]|jgi:hypothetical protein|nr:hypothetical protein [Treponema sp.]